MLKEKTTFKKFANVGGGKMRKKFAAKSTKIKTIQLSHGVNGLTWDWKNTHLPTQWLRLE